MYLNLIAAIVSLFYPEWLLLSCDCLNEGLYKYEDEQVFYFSNECLITPSSSTLYDLEETMATVCLGFHTHDIRENRSLPLQQLGAK